jgi:hypothetical protein
MSTIALAYNSSWLWGSGYRYVVPLTTVWMPGSGCDRIVTFRELAECPREDYAHREAGHVLRVEYPDERNQ